MGPAANGLGPACADFTAGGGWQGDATEMPSNESALTALAGVKRTAPLPAACPDDRAFFIVTFYCGETPPP